MASCSGDENSKLSRGQFVPGSSGMRSRSINLLLPCWKISAQREDRGDREADTEFSPQTRLGLMQNDVPHVTECLSPRSTFGQDWMIFFDASWMLFATLPRGIEHVFDTCVDTFDHLVVSYAYTFRKCSKIRTVERLSHPAV